MKSFFYNFFFITFVQQIKYAFLMGFILAVKVLHLDI